MMRTVKMLLAICVLGSVVFAGSGEERSRLEQLCHDLPCVFLGFCNQSEMPGIYAASDVLVLPSVVESWGLSVNEAMAAGKACIAT